MESTQGTCQAWGLDIHAGRCLQCAGHKEAGTFRFSGREEAGACLSLLGFSASSRGCS